MTKEIPLTQDQIVLVDDEWFDELNQYKWFAHYYPHTNSFYAQRKSKTLFGKRKKKPLTPMTKRLKNIMENLQN